MKWTNKIWAYLTSNFTPVLILYMIIGLVVSLQNWLLDSKLMGDQLHTHYNNYLIFKQSFFHLIYNKDLYQLYPAEHWDLYKYSPTFALLFAPLAILPDVLGLIIWNLINIIIVFWAIRVFPNFDRTQKIKLLLFIIFELNTSVQNAQSNCLMAGLIILGFVMLERQKYFIGILFITITIFIKIFGVFALALLLLYPNKIRSVIYTLACFSILFLVPLIIISPNQLMDLYASWYNLLVNDHSASYGLSVMGWLNTWFHWQPDKNFVVMVGLFLGGLPLLFWKRYSSILYRIALLSSLLIWIVIFNHKAESPTFIIAATGAGLWYFCKPRGTFDLILIALVFVFTTLSPVDIFPNYIQDNYFDPYVIKAVPCIFLWVRIFFDQVIWKDPVEFKLTS